MTVLLSCCFLLIYALRHFHTGTQAESATLHCIFIFKVKPRLPETPKYGNPGCEVPVFCHPISSLVFTNSACSADPLVQHCSIWLVSPSSCLRHQLEPGLLWLWQNVVELLVDGSSSLHSRVECTLWVWGQPLTCHNHTACFQCKQCQVTTTANLEMLIGL